MMIRKWMLLAAACGILTSAPAAQGDELQLTGVVRDLMRGDQDDGHPDFQTAGAMGRYGHVTGMVTMLLGDNGKPVYNPIRPAKDTIQSAASLAQWYTDVPELNLSEPLTLALTNGQDGPGGVYSYQNNAFWPIDGHMFGNQDLNHNFHFTFELHTTFTYTPNQQFTFIGDDDVWVYVNGMRVIDLGGVHSAVTGSIRLLDGKAFVEKEDFPLGGLVQSVTASMRNTLCEKWSNLGMSGYCPIAEGDYYIDLDLNNGGPDTRALFNGLSVTAYSAQDLSNVVLQFEDGSEQKFDELEIGPSGTFSGDGDYAGKTIIACWVKSGDNAGGDGPGKGQYHHVSGATSIDCTLDFFFAERHTTQSNFRIDTSMQLEAVDPSTMSPMYD